MPLQTEQLLGGRYRLEEPIGYGGMGRVFRATDELLDRPVAIKLLEPQPRGNQTPEIAEARAAARLSHPGVVHVFDVGVSDGEGQGYIVMELVPGRSLAEVLRERGKLAPNEAADLAAQVADALEAIHRHGMVHCDVKPLNIIVTPSGHTKLVDFGIARAAAEDGASLGSAPYIAPEQARGEPVEAPIDIYSLGAVLYEMLVGARPFKGGTTAELVRSRLIANPLPPRSLNPRIPRELEAIVLRALAREPGMRYASAGAMRDELRAFVSRGAEPTQVIGASTPSRRPSTSRWLRVIPLVGPVSGVSHALATRLAGRRAVAVAAAIVMCLLAVAGWRATHPPIDGVPRLVGLPLSQVPTALKDAGIAPADVTVLTRQVQAEYVGTVVDQQPQPGTPRNAEGGLQIAVGVRR